MQIWSHTVCLDIFSCLQTEVELNAFILSHVFWPNFREEKLKLPDFIQRYNMYIIIIRMYVCKCYCTPSVSLVLSKLEEYCACYKSHKGMRTLEWKPHLGLVQVCACCISLYCFGLYCSIQCSVCGI